MTQGSSSAVAVVMRRPDGTPMTKKEVIIERRGAFKWLPVLCSNDLVHGSWWFVWGSLLSMVIAIVPLADPKEQTDDALPNIDRGVTWSLLTVCGFFYTVGSYAFVRAFEEPPKLPLFHYIKHLQSDELLGAWLFLLGTIPSVPWSLVYFSINPGFVYMAAIIMSIVGVIGCGLFVLGCYPNDKKTENYLLPFCVQYCGSQIWMVKHLANDWLAGTWFFLWASFVFFIGTFMFFCIALSTNAHSQQIFIYTSGLFDALFFLIGSLYFVAGSYPHASQFYYALDRASTPKSSTTEKRQIKSYHRQRENTQFTNLLTNSLDNSNTGTRVLGTKSQTMDLRLTSNVVHNPLHGNIISSAGQDKDKASSSAISELHDKLKSSVDAMKSGKVSSISPSTSSGNIHSSGSSALLSVDVESQSQHHHSKDNEKAVDFLESQDDDDIEGDDIYLTRTVDAVISPLHVVANIKNEKSSHIQRNG